MNEFVLVVNTDDTRWSTETTPCLYGTYERAINDTVEWVMTRMKFLEWPMPDNLRQVVREKLQSDHMLVIWHVSECEKENAIGDNPPFWANEKLTWELFTNLKPDMEEK